MPTNQETMIIEKIVCFSQFLRRGGMPHCGVGWGGAHEKLLSLVTYRERRELWARAHLWYLQERRGEARSAGSGLAGLSISTGPGP